MRGKVRQVIAQVTMQIRKVTLAVKCKKKGKKINDRLVHERRRTEEVNLFFVMKVTVFFT